MSGKIFINYRRDDDPGTTGRLFDRLEAAFSRARLFIDVDHIRPGQDFVQVLETQVDQCDVLIAIVGQGWLGAMDETGRRRLDNPDDFVRIEIETALRLGKQVVPVLVNNARMPRAEQLPDPLKPFVRRNAVRLTYERFNADVQGLVTALQAALKDVEAAAERAREEAQQAEAQVAALERAVREAREKKERAKQPAEPVPDPPRRDLPRVPGYPPQRQAPATRIGQRLGALRLLVHVTWLLLVPLAVLLWKSVTSDAGSFTLSHYIGAYAGPRGEVLWNSIVFAGGAAALSLAIGALLAWTSERSDAPLRSLFFAVAILPLVVPSILFSLAWTMLAAPNAGLINRLLRYSFGPDAVAFNLYSMTGMVWVAGLYHVPIAFLLMSAALRASRKLGIGWRQVLGCFVLLFALVIGSFEVPLVVGMPAGVRVLTSWLYESIGFPTNYGLAAAYGVPLVLIAGVGLAAHSSLTGEAAKAREAGQRAAGGGGRRLRHAIPVVLYVLMAGVLPLFGLAWWSLSGYGSTFSLEAYYEMFQDAATGRAAINSAILAVGTATAVMVLGWSIGSRDPRTTSRWGKRVESIARLPLVLSGLVVGLAVLLCYSALGPGLYGTIWILLIAYIARFLPYATRHDAEDAGATPAGAGLQGILLPLWKPGTLAGWIIILIAAAGEFPSAVLLRVSDTQVLSVHLYNLLEVGDLRGLSALGIVMIAAFLILVLLAGLAARRLAAGKV